MKKNQGFTLVELSIVIVIIGLIVAGVTAGQNLIISSKIQSQISQLNKYNVAVNTFNLEYGAIPGDFANANQYWTGATVGDGNGRMTHHGDEASTVSNENIKFFEHLSLAKLVEGTYSNVWSIDSGYPRLKIDSAKGMVAANSSGGSGTPNQRQLSLTDALIKYKVALELNVSRPGLGGAAYNDSIGISSPKMFYVIDNKFDDGIARSGLFKSHRAFSSTEGNCLDSDSGDYILTNDDNACMGEYIIIK